MLRNIEMDISCFKKLDENKFLQIDLSKESVGRSMRNLFYNKDADYIFLNYGNKKDLNKALEVVKPQKLIIDFYMWDCTLKRYEDISKYINDLNRAKSLGVDKCVQIDFSVWYNDPQPIQLANLYKNFIRLHIAQQLGFLTVLNFNTILPYWYDIYEYVLPKRVNTVFMDNGHGEFRKDKNHTQNEIKALHNLLSLTEVKTFIIQSSKVSDDDMKPFAYELKKAGIEYAIIPSQTKVLGLFYKRR